MPVDLAGTRATRVREAVTALAAEARDPLELLAEASERVRTVLPFDGGAWMTCDPETILPTGSVAYDDDRLLSQQILHNELFEPDLNKFADLARRGIGAASLQEATAGHLELSPRVREINQPRGLGDELRICFSTPEGLWGGACLPRATDAHAYSQDELRYAAAIGDELGRGLRRAFAAQVRSEAYATGTGMLVLGADGTLELSSGEADAWLANMPPDPLHGTLPMTILGVALQAHAREARGDDLPPARARVRLRTGQWLLVHASVLRDASGAPTRTAVVLEPAERSRIAGLLLTLYGLTGREREVAELLIRGLATDEVAERLTISRHTVRDHVKAIFAKVGVTSRPELTALVTSDS